MSIEQIPIVSSDLTNLVNKLRGLDIWYRFCDSHDDYMIGKRREDEYKQLLNGFNLSVEQKVEMYNDPIFKDYNECSKNILKEVLGLSSDILEKMSKPKELVRGAAVSGENVEYYK